MYNIKQHAAVKQVVLKSEEVEVWAVEFLEAAEQRGDAVSFEEENGFTIVTVSTSEGKIVEVLNVLFQN